MRDLRGKIDKEGSVFVVPDEFQDLCDEEILRIDPSIPDDPRPADIFGPILLECDYFIILP
jgi:hypothetical protein